MARTKKSSTRKREVAIDHSSWSTITEDGIELEAVFRVQEASSAKKCSKKDCPLNVKIQPMMSYVRIFYRDTRAVEMMHTGCFYLEFPNARNR